MSVMYKSSSAIIKARTNRPSYLQIQLTMYLPTVKFKGGPSPTMFDAESPTIMFPIPSQRDDDTLTESSHTPCTHDEVVSLIVDVVPEYSTL